MLCQLARISRRLFTGCTPIYRTSSRYSKFSSTSTLAVSSVLPLEKKHYSNTIASDKMISRPVSTGDRLKRLRELMANPRYNVNAYIVPSEDAHQSEYVASCDERRAFISGFDGSAGCAVITMDKAAMFTDGRYFLQARKQMDENWTLMKRGMPGIPSWQEYLVDHLPEGTRVGVDPTVIAAPEGEKLKKALQTKGSGGDLVSIEENLVDKVWGPERPSQPKNEVFVQEMKYAGELHTDKIARVREAIKKEGVDGLVISALDEIAWLLNLRGSDIDYNPVFIAYVLVTQSDVTLYIDEGKLTKEVREHLGAISVKPYNEIFKSLVEHSTGLLQSKRQFFVGTSASWALVRALGADNVKTGLPPVTPLKAQKNAAEIEGMRQCHIRDGAAMANYFGWLENELLNGDGNLQLTEVDVAEKLEGFRRAEEHCVGLSFTTISAVGANGAIIHYSPQRGSDAKMDTSQMYLCDSGGQYLDGTTDVTRTYHFGEPTAWQRECFTRVLKGHIALDSAIFPNGTSGYALDPLARLPLWELGLDYRHGTGHGVGSFLNVHEGPQRIGMSKSTVDFGLHPNMTITNEPGYYEDGNFGIRIENTCVVIKVDTPHDYTGGSGFLKLDPVTMVPIQKQLVLPELFTDKERKWLNSYHQLVWEKVSPLLEKGGLGYEWLKRETAPM